MTDTKTPVTKLGTISEATKEKNKEIKKLKKENERLKNKLIPKRGHHIIQDLQKQLQIKEETNCKNILNFSNHELELRKQLQEKDKEIKKYQELAFKSFDKGLKIGRIEATQTEREECIKNELDWLEHLRMETQQEEQDQWINIAIRNRIRELKSQINKEEQR